MIWAHANYATCSHSIKSALHHNIKETKVISALILTETHLVMKIFSPDIARSIVQILFPKIWNQGHAFPLIKFQCSERTRYTETAGNPQPVTPGVKNHLERLVVWTDVNLGKYLHVHVIWKRLCDVCIVNVFSVVQLEAIVPLWRVVLR